jgi:hypothetical protein
VALDDATLFAAGAATFAGVDEAGLGPLLGPLTLGYSVFTAPHAAVDLWSALAPLVSQDPRDDARAFVVADSKVVFKRTPRCSKRLEATALGFLALLDAARRPERTLQSLLFEAPADLAVEAPFIARHAWYRDAARPLPHHWNTSTLEVRVESLSRALRKAQVELVDAGVRTVTESALNASLEATQNKSLTHWSFSAPIFRRVFENHGARGVELWVDRHGGRSHYGPLLGRAFPEALVEWIDETPQCSRYSVRMRDGARRMRIVFSEKAERSSFAVALGSCLAKYARESAMDAFNAHFGAFDATLAPTAGYTTDARRWLNDSTALRERIGLAPADFVRQR